MNNLPKKKSGGTNPPALCRCQTETVNSGTALLSQEGSGIAKRIPRGEVPQPMCSGFGTTPALRATPPDSGGESSSSPNSHQTLSTETTPRLSSSIHGDR